MTSEGVPIHRGRQMFSPRRLGGGVCVWGGGRLMLFLMNVVRRK